MSDHSFLKKKDFEKVGSCENIALFYVGYSPSKGGLFVPSSDVDSIDTSLAVSIDQLLKFNPDAWDLDEDKIGKINSLETTDNGNTDSPPTN